MSSNASEIRNNGFKLVIDILSDVRMLRSLAACTLWCIYNAHIEKNQKTSSTSEHDKEEHSHSPSMNDESLVDDFLKFVRKLIESFDDEDRVKELYERIRKNSECFSLLLESGELREGEE